MIELYLQYQISSSLFKELLMARADIGHALKSRPMDIQLEKQKAMIENDLQATQVIIENCRPLILASLESRHGIKFQYLQQTVQKPSVVIQKPNS